MQTLAPGTRIGPYEVTEHLAVGGMAHVYRVWHSGLHRHEAMKVPLTRLGHDPSFLRRFFQEARLAAKLQHPNIVGIYSVSEAFGESAKTTIDDDAISYFTMELVDGTDLDRILGDRGRLSLDESIPLLRGIADALDYAHARGVIHRDMKPSNVLLQKVPDGSGGFIAKVSDFGIARAAAVGEDTDTGAPMMRQTRLTKVGAILGTPAYMSPEQAEGGTSIVPASDQYALGIIAYELLCGHTPFPWNPESPMTVILSHLRDMPPPISGIGPGPVDMAVNAVLNRALGKLASQRYPNCRAFVDALDMAGHSHLAYGGGMSTNTGTPYPPPQAQSFQGTGGIMGTGNTGSVSFGPGGQTGAITDRQPTSSDQVVQQQRKSNNTPWIIGGSIVAIAAVGGVATMLLTKHDTTNQNPPHTPVASTGAGTPKTTVTPPPPDEAAKADALISQASEQLATVNAQYQDLFARGQKHQLSDKEARAAKAKLVPMVEKALSETKQALAIDPHNKDAMELTVDALIYLGRNVEAKKRCKDALALYPDDKGFKQRLAFVKASGG